MWPLWKRRSTGIEIGNNRCMVDTNTCCWKHKGAYYVTKGNRRVIGTNSQSFLPMHWSGTSWASWSTGQKVVIEDNTTPWDSIGWEDWNIYWIIISQKDGCSYIYADIFRNFRSSSIVRNTHKTITSTPLNMSTWLQGVEFKPDAPHPFLTEINGFVFILASGPTHVISGAWKSRCHIWISNFGSWECKRKTTTF